MPDVWLEEAKSLTDAYKCYLLLHHPLSLHPSSSFSDSVSLLSKASCSQGGLHTHCIAENNLSYLSCFHLQCKGLITDVAALLCLYGAEDWTQSVVHTT